MPTKLQGIITMFLLLACAQTLAASTVIENRKDADLYGTGGTVVDDLALTSTRYTGWINVSQMAKIVFEISLTDANSSVAAVQMKCWGESDASTANGSGYRAQAISVAAGTANSYDAVWDKGTLEGAPGTSEWSWIFDNLTHPYVNCSLEATSGAAAADKISVVARGRTP